MTVLFCYLGVHEEIVQRTLAKLANWPSFAPADLDVLLQKTLAHVENSRRPAGGTGM